MSSEAEASVDPEPLDVGPELNDGAESDDPELEDDTPELLSEFVEPFEGGLVLAIGEETLLVWGACIGSARVTDWYLSSTPLTPVATGGS